VDVRFECLICVCEGPTRKSDDEGSHFFQSREIKKKAGKYWKADFLFEFLGPTMSSAPVGIFCHFHNFVIPKKPRAQHLPPYQP
jgi:hypothetical protein